MKEADPKCQSCRHFFITWNKNTPYGCRRFMIESGSMPSVVVKNAGHGACQEFELKALKKALYKSEEGPKARSS